MPGHEGRYATRVYVESVELSGFGGLPKWEGALGRVARFEGTPRALGALGDALLLGCASFDPAALESLLTRWHCEGLKLAEEGASWDRAPGLGAILDPEAEGLLRVALTFQLDPPQFGKFRDHAARDPRLVDALGAGARVTVRTGARFAAGMDAVAIDALSFTVGEVAFAMHGSERPAWLTPVLAGLRSRLRRGPAPAARWGECARSWSASDQLALRRALAALAAPPASLGDPLALPEGPAILTGAQVVPARILGAEAAAGLIGAVHLCGADIAVVDELPAGEGWLDWLAAQAEAAASPLEQVIVLGAPGGTRLGD